MKKIIGVLLLALPAFGATVYTLGTNEFADGTVVTPGSFQTGIDPAPLNLVTGGDATANASFTLTFNFAPTPGITSASILLILWDLESLASSNQIGSFILNGSEDLTGSLNALGETASSAAQQITYLNLILPLSAFDELATGTATFVLTFSGPALGALGETSFNGGGVDFVQLSLDTAPAEVPEPSSVILSGLGLGLLAWRARARWIRARG